MEGRAWNPRGALYAFQEITVTLSTYLKKSANLTYLRKLSPSLE
jgi:hypothetical protein